MNRSLAAAAFFASLACGGGERSDAPRLDVASVDMKFARIPAGSFDMGSDSKRFFDQNPVHRVTISKPFELQTTEVTQAQWVAVMGANPSHFQGDRRPVEQVSWNDAFELIATLNARDPGKNYRLPTEAEWEYACRAGTDEARYGEPERIAWFDANSEAAPPLSNPRLVRRRVDLATRLKSGSAASALHQGFHDVHSFS